MSWCYKVLSPTTEQYELKSIKKDNSEYEEGKVTFMCNDSMLFDTSSDADHITHIKILISKVSVIAGTLPVLMYTPSDPENHHHSSSR